MADEKAEMSVVGKAVGTVETMVEKKDTTMAYYSVHRSDVLKVEKMAFEKDIQKVVQTEASTALTLDN